MHINFENRNYIAYEEKGTLIIYFGDLRTCRRYLNFLEEEGKTFKNITRIDGAANFTPNCKIMRHIKKSNISKCIVLSGGKKKYKTEGTRNLVCWN